MNTIMRIINIPTLAAVTLITANLAYGDFNPVPLASSSFNQDVVVEKTAPGPIGRATTASLDSGTNNSQNSWYEVGFNTAAPSTGLPAAGSTFVSAASATHQYQMAPTYATNNAVLIDAGVKRATWTLVTPATETSLSFLTSGGHNGLTNIGVIIHHQDNSTEKASFASPDWFNGASPAVTANGRVDVQTFAFNNVNSGNPRLYSRDITVTNTASPVTSIDFTNQSTSGGDVCILAVSGAATAGGSWLPLSVTGYNADMIVEAGAPQPTPLTTATSASMDNGTANTGNTWFERGYDPFFPTSGFPLAGSTLSSSNQPDHHYTMPASYAVNDAAMVDASSPTVNITPASPAAFSAMAFLGAAANGAVTNNCTVQHQNGTSENFTIIMPDWVSSSPVAYYANGRLTLDTRAITNQNLTPQNVRLYEPQIALANTVSPVTNIVLTWQSGAPNSRVAVFALSGTAGAVPPIISSSPSSVLTYEGSNEVFSVAVSGGTTPISYQWQKGTNGTYANITDAGNISGSHTPDLTILNIGLSDSADYRCVVSNVVAAVNSGVATLTVLSILPDVTAPGDTIASYGSAQASPIGEEVTHAIDNDTAKFLNFGGGTTPFSGVAGLVVTPASGQSRVTAMRIYTANDVPARDPAAYTLEGSNDGGNTYTLIASGSLALPDGRNNPGSATDPLSQYMQQVSFVNSSAYSTYRLVFTAVKNASLANSCQIGEVELLGNNVNLNIGVDPSFQSIYGGTGASAQLNAYVTPVDPSTTFRWQKATNGTYVSLTDNAHVSGSATTNLTINNVVFADEANYVLFVSNSTVSAASQPAWLNVLSSGVDITAPGDTITTYGPLIASPANEGVTNAIDNTSYKFLCYGNGATTPVAFVGPAGFVVTPAKGKTVVTGLRFYTANDFPERDPADYKLEGSNDGGATYSLIATGTLTLPKDRNALALPTDPVAQPNQEVRFANTRSFSTYRLTSNTVKNNAVATSMQYAEVELLGTTAVTLTITRGPGAGFTITTSAPGELLSTTNIANPVWVDEGPITTSVTLTPAPNQPRKFYRVQTQ
jgi:hypothetical protein